MCIVCVWIVGDLVFLIIKGVICGVIWVEFEYGILLVDVC